MTRGARLSLALFLTAMLPGQTRQPDAASLVTRALGPGIVPYAAVKPLIADFNGDGQPDLAVVVDFNRHLSAWLKRGDVILDLDSPGLSRMRLDNEQHFCFGLLLLENMQPDRKTLFYGCFTGWHLVPGSKAALDLDMDSGSGLRLYYDGSRYRTRAVHRN